MTRDWRVFAARSLAASVPWVDRSATGRRRSTALVVAGRPLWVKREGDSPPPTAATSSARSRRGSATRASAARAIWAIGAYGSNHVDRDSAARARAGLDARR